MQINSKLNSKPYDYLYKLNNHEVPLRRSNARLSVQTKYRPSRVETFGIYVCQNHAMHASRQGDSPADKLCWIRGVQNDSANKVIRETN